MMDVFNEHMVRRRISAAQVVLMSLIILGAVIIGAVAFLFVPTVGAFIVVGMGYLAYWLLSRFFIEYEYIVTNGIMDVDRITSRKRRKRVIICDCRDCEIIAPVPLGPGDQHIREYETPSVNHKVDCSSGVKERAYFLLFTHKKHGKTRLIFDPNEKMLNAFKLYIPRKVFEREKLLES